jgi:hypothetical protein
VLRANDQLGIHASSRSAPDGFGCSYGMSGVQS